MRKGVIMRTLFVALAVVVSVGAEIAQAEDIRGPILLTKTIFEDSQLVEDVTCAPTATPCIDFGASNITLRLNGFILTGPAEPDPADPENPAASPNLCPSAQPANADGIRIRNQTHARVLGPGMVQNFF